MAQPTDIPLVLDPLALGDWRKAARLVSDRCAAAGLAVDPAVLAPPAGHLPAASAERLAALADAAAAAAKRYADMDALLARETELSSAWTRWRYAGDGTAAVHALRGDRDRPEAELDDARRCTVLESLDPLPAAPLPGVPLRHELVRRCLASVREAMLRCRYLFAPPSAFTPARQTVWAYRAEDWDFDGISRVGPDSEGFASAAAWLSAFAGGGARSLGGGQVPGVVVNPHATVTPNYPLYQETWRVLGDEAAGGGAGYPSVLFSVPRHWAAVETLTYRDPNGPDPTSYSYGRVFPCALGGAVSLSAEGAGMVPRNPRALAVRWHLWPGGWDRADIGWSASDEPRLVPISGLYADAKKLAWDTADGYSRDADLWHLTRGPWVQTGRDEPLVPAAAAFPSDRAWLSQPDDLHGGAFCQSTPVASVHITAINGTDYYGYAADLALIDVGEPQETDTP